MKQMLCRLIQSIVFYTKFLFSDVNECLGAKNPCSNYAECINEQGSVRCKCLEGYQGDGLICKGKTF